MSTAVGNRLINGGSVKYHSAQGQGIARTVAAKAFEMGANAAVQKLAKMIKGDGYLSLIHISLFFKKGILSAGNTPINGFFLPELNKYVPKLCN